MPKPELVTEWYVKLGADKQIELDLLLWLGSELTKSQNSWLAALTYLSDEQLVKLTTRDPYSFRTTDGTISLNPPRDTSGGTLYIRDNISTEALMAALKQKQSFAFEGMSPHMQFLVLYCLIAATSLPDRSEDE